MWMAGVIIRRLRAMPGREAVPVLMITANDQKPCVTAHWIWEPTTF